MFRKYSILIGLPVVSLALTAFSNPFQAAGQNSGIPWWVWVLIILVVVLFLWWWLSRRPEEEVVPTAKVEREAPPPIAEAPAPVERPAPPTEEEAVPAAKVEAEAPPTIAEAPAPVERPAPPTPDDLRRIEGIGPKISSVLQAAGITTFAQLAETDVSRLQQILREAGIRLADPSTWPDQARLAAASEWDALKALQDQLKGGRRA